MQQGFPTATPLQDAAPIVTANAARHYPAAAVGTPTALRTAALTAAGIYFAEVVLTGDLTAPDLTDPQEASQHRIQRATGILNALSGPERAAAIAAANGPGFAPR